MSDRLTTVAVAAVLVFAACSPPMTDGPIESTATRVEAAVASPTSASSTITTVRVDLPARGGTVVIGDDQEPPTLNPYVPGGDNHIVDVLGQMHMAGAFDVDPHTGELLPELATDVPTVANGGVVRNEDGTMTVEWEIQDEATWSDGVPITGADFEFTIEYRKAVETCFASGYEGTFDGAAESVGEKSFSYRFDQPGFHHETALTWIVPKHAVAGSDYCLDWNHVAWPAAGPFVIENWEFGESIELVRNEHYWKNDEAGAPLPYLDEVELRFVPETQMILDMFGNRELDVIQPPAVPEVIEGLAVLAGAEIETVSGPILDLIAFQFGHERKNPLSLTEHRAFREAVVAAVDRDELVTQMWGGLLETPPLDRWAVHDLTGDPAELLAAACAAENQDCDAVPPSILISTNALDPRKAEAINLIGDQLTAVGIDPEVVPEDTSLIWDPRSIGWWDVKLLSLPVNSGTAGLIEKAGWFDPDGVPWDGLNVFSWGAPGSTGVDEEAVQHVREILKRLRSTIDVAEAYELAESIEEIVANEVIAIPISGRMEIGAVWADEIEGFQMNATAGTHTWNIETWRRVDL